MIGGEDAVLFLDSDQTEFLGAHGILTTSARIELTTQESDHATRRRHQARG